ncbi:MAG TPA: beta-eliminating lyase-related protein [Aliidongia sp.]|uniref:threonine aldolase family protein n=1 Tax=Aliidongia sp. TaxID=1914230 RepID=UPI002DDD2608|nr:beta-eliminating lyase-related protein [Aliidongia sp.]HEV2675597.1 beta-eliminating lyase-related protein [Aliidongia sp.]
MPTAHAEIRDLCRRALSGHRRQTVRETLDQLAQSPFADLPRDIYGEGEAMQALERDVAALLGKPAAVFMPKGVIAQQAALRIWADRSGLHTVGLHPKCHIDLDERSAYERLHGLQGVRLGLDHRPFGVTDLEAAAEEFGVVTVELPLRRAGFKLPDWDDLVAIADWCRSRGVPLHFDGARLWEAQPHYGRPLAEIAGLADSAYVSFYKGLGGLGGSILAGPVDFIAAARVWQGRHGGNLWTAFPFVISAAEGLKRYLPLMPAYRDRARRLAAALAAVPGVTAVPAPPHTNAFQLYLPASAKALDAAHQALARDSGVWLFGRFAETAVPDLTMAEIGVGDAADDLTDGEIVDLVGRLVATARAS